MGALIVREGTGGIKPLTDRDRREIGGTARKLLATDRNPEAVFTATAFEPDGNGGGTVSGTFTLRRRRAPAQAAGQPGRPGPLPRHRLGAAVRLRDQAVHRVPRRAEGTRRGRHRGRHRLVGTGGGAGMTSPEDHAPAAAAAPAAADGNAVTACSSAGRRRCRTSPTRPGRWQPPATTWRSASTGRQARGLRHRRGEHRRAARGRRVRASGHRRASARCPRSR